MKNGVTAEIAVTHTFDVVSGIWTAGAWVGGGANVLCYTDPSGEKRGGCGKPYHVQSRRLHSAPRAGEFGGRARFPRSVYGAYSKSASRPVSARFRSTTACWPHTGAS